MSAKISKEGKYLDFFGLTSICFVQNGGTKKIYDFLLSSSFSKVYQPLPPESYHMTAFDIMVPPNHQTTETFDAFLSKFSGAISMLKEVCSKCSDQSAVPVMIYYRGTLGIELSMKGNQIRELRQEMSRVSGIENKPYKFHMTLGYKYSDKTIDPADMDKLRELCLEVFRDGILWLSEPKVCYFKSMKEFIEC